MSKEELEQNEEKDIVENENEEASQDDNDSEAQIKELNDKYLRLYSEFENFRRRSAKEKLDIINSASAGLARELLVIIDDFDRATKANKDIDDPTTLKEGFSLIHDKLIRTLSGKGLKEIDALGKPFDVDIHEAITQIEVQDPDQKGKVVDVVEKGYYYNDSVLRYAKVVVGQ